MPGRVQAQEWVYYGKVKEGPGRHALLRQVLALTGAMPRHNPGILPPPDGPAATGSPPGAGAP